MRSQRFSGTVARRCQCRRQAKTSATSQTRSARPTPIGASAASTQWPFRKPPSAGASIKTSRSTTPPPSPRPSNPPLTREPRPLWSPQWLGSHPRCGDQTLATASRLPKKFGVRRRELLLPARHSGGHVRQLLSNVDVFRIQFVERGKLSGSRADQLRAEQAGYIRRIADILSAGQKVGLFREVP